MPCWGQITFEDMSTNTMLHLIHYHDLTFILTAVISSGVLWALGWAVLNNRTYRTLPNSELLETTWTVAPGVILLTLAFPSLKNLYLQDEVADPYTHLKVVGSQWYWTYEIASAGADTPGNYTFSSYLSPDKATMFDVDKRVVVPSNETIRLLVSSTDVIHAWTVLGSGVKVDAVPGRINQSQVCFNRSGVFYGQCSELCGVNHAFMPIMVEAIPKPYFLSWLQSVVSDSA
uniref:Cytochrome c oxidase subunit 2 n=1 Tax=Lyonsia norwegica TaxID=228471 RepID=A0A1U9XPH0_LYONO|nr:cytochrome c oxidase subunit II [Lyonsia norwegica]AQZ26150.1 cytochrome c oxidase subunit II [Lyonsia norwegica]